MPILQSRESREESELLYSWPEDIRGLNSAREKRRAHMKAVMWREQVLHDDVDAKTLESDACVLELTLSKRSACEDVRSFRCCC